MDNCCAGAAPATAGSVTTQCRRACLFGQKRKEAERPRLYSIMTQNSRHLSKVACHRLTRRHRHLERTIDSHAHGQPSTDHEPTPSRTSLNNHADLPSTNVDNNNNNNSDFDSSDFDTATPDIAVGVEPRLAAMAEAGLEVFPGA